MITVIFLHTKDPKGSKYFNRIVCDIHKYIHDVLSRALGANHLLV